MLPKMSYKNTYQVILVANYLIYTCYYMRTAKKFQGLDRKTKSILNLWFITKPNCSNFII